MTGGENNLGICEKFNVEKFQLLLSLSLFAAQKSSSLVRGSLRILRAFYIEKSLRIMQNYG